MTPEPATLYDFATRYTAAWCSQDPLSVARHYHWTLIGTNSGPGGTGHRVRINGYEDGESERMD